MLELSLIAFDVFAAPGTVDGLQLATVAELRAKPRQVVVVDKGEVIEICFFRQSPHENAVFGWCLARYLCKELWVNLGHIVFSGDIRHEWRCHLFVEKFFPVDLLEEWMVLQLFDPFFPAANPVLWGLCK